MKIALVHDYLSEFGGAERVLLALHELWPEAPIYTAFLRQNSPAEKALKNAKIIESWLAPLLKIDRLFSPLRFLTPLIWQSFNLEDYDLVISSASWYITRGFKVGSKTKVVCYCHTPPRYLYGYPTSTEWQKYALIRLYALIVNHFLRAYDFRTAQKVDEFIVNSQNVARRVKKFYRREATVIYPPVNTDKRNTQDARRNTGEYFLAGGRLEGPKNFDLIIKACKQIKVRLKIFGTGTKEKYLKEIGGREVEFLGQIDDRKREALMSGCRAFMVAAEDEDFGITPLEAMAMGRPVIAFRGGGYLETVVEGKTGVFFDQLTTESLSLAIKQLSQSNYWESGECRINCREQAKKFSRERFKREIKEFAERLFNIDPETSSG